MESLGQQKDRETVSKIYLCDMVHSPAPSFHGHQILHHAPKIEHSKKKSLGIILNSTHRAHEIKPFMLHSPLPKRTSD